MTDTLVFSFASLKFAINTWKMYNQADENVSEVQVIININETGGNGYVFYKREN